MNLTATLIESTNTFQTYFNAERVNPYSNSPIRLFQQMSSKKKGAAFEKLIEEILISKGYSVNKPLSSDHDRLVNGVKVEIKGSLGWVTDGVISHYRFQQIRSSQDYEVVLFAFFTPQEVILKAATKADAMKHLSQQAEDGTYPHNQHGGKRVNSGCFFIDCLPGECDWMVDVEELI